MQLCRVREGRTARPVACSSMPANVDITAFSMYKSTKIKYVQSTYRNLCIYLCISLSLSLSLLSSLEYIQSTYRDLYLYVHPSLRLPLSLSLSLPLPLVFPLSVSLAFSSVPYRDRRSGVLLAGHGLSDLRAGSCNII